MCSARRWLVLASSLAALAGCSDDGAAGAPSASASAAATPPPASAASAAPTASAAAAAPSAAPAAPRSDCPKDSSGPGTLDQPCTGKGASRLMTAKWTGKIDDEKGPFFAVKNEGPAPVLYGKIAVYFYDKDKKQLEVKHGAAKPMPYLVCAGSNLFSGVMKVKEKATLTFSCVKKDHVPEGTKSIEGEIMMVGFADASEKKNEFYWSNKDLAPDVRPLGGVK